MAEPRDPVKMTRCAEGPPRGSMRCGKILEKVLQHQCAVVRFIMGGVQQDERLVAGGEQEFPGGGQGGGELLPITVLKRVPMCRIVGKPLP